MQRFRFNYEFAPGYICEQIIVLSRLTHLTYVCATSNAAVDVTHQMLIQNHFVFDADSYHAT